MADDTAADFAVVVYREDGRWVAASLPDHLLDDLDGLIAALRQQPGEGGAIALVDIADEFFVAIRLVRGAVRMLLSDSTAAADWDLAAQVTERLELPAPAEDSTDELWPAGDTAIFADIGLDAMELSTVLGDLDAYADEMLLTIAHRLGFIEPYERVVEAATR